MKKGKSPLKNILSFANKTVLITGAASGIGKAIAQRFSESHATLILLDLDTQGLKKTILSCKENRDKHSFYTIDLSDKKEIDKLWENLKEEELPDILVNNAGIYPMMDYLKIDEEYLQKTLDVNMNSAFWMCQNFIKRRKSKGGVIVNLSSIEAILPFKKDLIHYTMSKAGVIALTRSLARDYGKKGFRANVILPGAIMTSGTKSLINDAILKVKVNLIKTGYDFKQRLAYGRWGKPDDIAKAVLFLSSNLATYIQGAVLPVDGGFLSS